LQSRRRATSNDLLPRRVLDHGMTHVMAPDKRRRQRLASGANLQASERYLCHINHSGPFFRTQCIYYSKREGPSLTLEVPAEAFDAVSSTTSWRLPVCEPPPTAASVTSIVMSEA